MDDAELFIWKEVVRRELNKSFGFSIFLALHVKIILKGILIEIWLHSHFFRLLYDTNKLLLESCI